MNVATKITGRILPNLQIQLSQSFSLPSYLRIQIWVSIKNKQILCIKLTEKKHQFVSLHTDNIQHQSIMKLSGKIGVKATLFNL